MPKVGTATAPLHGGHCPPWLFQKMTQLSAAIVEAIIVEFGTKEVLRRFADPVWFQAFGAVIGFDWHSSGLTTVGLGALKEGLSQKQRELGLFIVGGKGNTARQTPREIDAIGERAALPQDIGHLKDTSRLVAKVDNALVQDGYQLYHHVMIFTADGQWTVIQQGMNDQSQTARRYHWLSDTVKSFTVEPHHGIVGRKVPHVLNLTEKDNVPIQHASLQLARQPEEVLLALRSLRMNHGEKELIMPSHHDIPQAQYLNKALDALYQRDLHSYQDLVMTPGVGAKTLRALAMVAEIIFGSPITYHDPVRYSFAHGGKDGIPYPVNRRDYNHSLQILEEALNKARIDDRTKLASLRRLAHWDNPTQS
ncbi:hypothetical protein SAMN00768000_2227 [Sulfobacillus thermosulfidooxidans DSM 9293]|uniref:DUF763 domain-containing protein n=1 Tax=Sulfobacillus thermosulfidooxidans (strain DSM 9293 / VKM B-1269 / AT-1) TaxID=929705 RepID=A0A1W1WGH0_SULTA|nr:DUF763 domain-containing protein [Sulfobacillus thermosulfidooxidans]SMC05401.1 hypothetical protein SAMN00768000_2227 [Sulfobacillus thermosulfidooxidans DSM 9293]